MADNYLFVRKNRSSLFYFYSSFRCMPNSGQEWSYRERIKYTDGRDSAFSEWRITNLGQE